MSRLKLETLKDLIEEHLKVAKQTFKEEGEVTPTLIGYSGSKRIMMPLIFDDPQAKEMILRMVSLVMIAERITRYTVAFEGWSLKGENNEDAIAESQRLYQAGLTFADSPMRVEIFSTLACSYTEKRMVIYEIGENRELIETSDQDDFDSLKGRFFELLPPEKPNEEQIQIAKTILDMGKVDLRNFGLKEETLH